MTNERITWNPLNADMTLIDEKGLRINRPGIIDSNMGCTHPACKKAIKAGRPVHLITPTYADDNASLSMRNHHYATVYEAQQAYLNVRHNAVTARTASERDAAYARNVDVWIVNNIDLNA